MPPAGLVNGKAHNEYLQSVICHFSSHSSLRRERPLSLKALNDIGYRCKTIYPTNSILCSFDPKQIANRGMGLNQPQNDSARREFRMQRPQHPGARKIDRRRGWEITNNEAQRFSLSFYAIEHDSEHVVDIEVDESGLHPESEDTGNSLIIFVAGEIREAASTRDTPQENLLLMAIAKGLPLKAACKLAGLGFTTFNGWREEDSFFAQKIEFAEAQAIERNLELIERAALKDWKAAARLLERRHPDMFARPEVQLGQHVSVQVPSNEVISWLSKTLPSIENLARTATSDQEDLGQKPQS